MLQTNFPRKYQLKVLKKIFMYGNVWINNNVYCIYIGAINSGISLAMYMQCTENSNTWDYPLYAFII